MRYRELLEFQNNEEALTAIFDECSEATALFRQTKKLFLRGTSSHRGETIFKGTIRTGREPRDSGKRAHQAIDTWMEENGFAARRSNSLFVTSLMGQASQYGTPYVIFPQNGFKYTWYENVDDLWFAISNLQYAMVEASKKAETWARDTNQDLDVEAYCDKWLKEHIDGFMQKMNPSTENIATAMRKNHEIQITGVEYYAVNYKKLGPTIRRLLGITK